MAKDVHQRIVAAHPDTPAAQLVQLAATFQPSMLREVETTFAAFEVPPAELEAMRVVALLASGAVERAVTAAEALLARAGGVLSGRWASALVFHARTLGQAEDSDERRRWAARRDVQLDWLIERAAVDDVRRAQWAEMRAVR